MTPESESKLGCVGIGFRIRGSRVLYISGLLVQGRRERREYG